MRKKKQNEWERVEREGMRNDKRENEIQKRKTEQERKIAIRQKKDRKHSKCAFLGRGVFEETKVRDT